MPEKGDAAPELWERRGEHVLRRGMRHPLREEGIMEDVADPCGEVIPRRREMVVEDAVIHRREEQLQLRQGEDQTAVGETERVIRRR